MQCMISKSKVKLSSGRQCVCHYFLQNKAIIKQLLLEDEVFVISGIIRVIGLFFRISQKPHAFNNYLIPCAPVIVESINRNDVVLVQRQKTKFHFLKLKI